MLNNRRVRFYEGKEFTTTKKKPSRKKYIRLQTKKSHLKMGDKKNANAST